jgi:hypothetical protein
MRRPRLSRASILSAAIILGATAAVSLALSGCASAPRKTSAQQVREIPYKQAAIYAADIPTALARPAAERIAEAPAAFLEWARKADRMPGYASYLPTEDERRLFAEYYGLLPERFKGAFEARVLGVFFVENFLGGGMSDFVFAEDGTEYNILVLNPRILKASLSEWISFRDSSPYQDDGKGLSMSVSCTGDYKALIHTLVHESAHIYDYGFHATPFVEPAIAQGDMSPSGKPFTKGAWKGYAVREERYTIPNIDRTAFYGLGKKLPLSEALEQYRSLARTPFASLYDSASWVEDFAESAAWTWLGERLGVEYTVRLLRDGSEILAFSPGRASGPDGNLAEREAALRNSLF